MDEIKTILILLFAILLLNSAKGETNAQNITIEFHQVWDFSSETDATVTDIISTNEDWIITGGIGLQDSVVVNYFLYTDDSNSPPWISVYRPTVDNSVQGPNFLLAKNKTLIKKYTILQVSQPNKFLDYFERDTFFFPFDEYDFLLTLPVQDYNQEYSADIIFPASFEIKNVTIRRPLIEQQMLEGWTFILAGIGQRNEIPQSKSIEEYKYKAYVPLTKVPNSVLVDKYTGHVKDPNKYFLMVKYTYGRPTFFLLIFFISLVFMLLVTYLSFPLKNKKEIMQYSLTISSIWAGQEGVSFIQGHRPLTWTLYDSTIFIIIIYVIFLNPFLIYLKTLVWNFIVNNKIGADK